MELNRWHIHCSPHQSLTQIFRLKRKPIKKKAEALLDETGWKLKEDGYRYQKTSRLA